MSNYDKIYGKDTKYFGNRSLLVDSILSHIKAYWCLLDLGIWQWYMAIELAKWWFTQVIWVDNSQIWLDRFVEFSEKEEIRTEAICCDIKDFYFEWEYNCIIASLSLQFLPNQASFDKIMHKIKMHTKNYWYVYISVPTKTKIADNFNYMCQNQQELKNYFYDREILFTKEYESKFKNWNTWTIANILAQKK